MLCDHRVLVHVIKYLLLFTVARLRGVQDGLFTGQIDAVDTSAATYRVTFDRNGLGTHTVPDYEVLVRLVFSHYITLTAHRVIML